MKRQKTILTTDRPRRCVRNGFDSSGGVICKSCFAKDREIERLREEIRRLKGLERYQRKKTLIEPFGENTPSSKILMKPNATEENTKKVGGGKLGHPGHGRKTVDRDQAIETVEHGMPESCPDCGLHLHNHDWREKTIVDVEPPKARQTRHRFQRGCCPGCGKHWAAPQPAFPKSMYSNRLVAQAAVQHFVHGLSLGKVCEIFGEHVKAAGLRAAFHRLADLARPAQDDLIRDYRQAAVKHADETSWRNDGQSGYGWLFCSERTSVFRFERSRSGKIAHAVFGPDRLPGTLVVDRYHAYNHAPCNIQYCYAHLLREVDKLIAEFPTVTETQVFAETFGNHLRAAMRLRRQEITDEEYYERAATIQTQMKAMLESEAKHLGIIHIQNIFTKSQHRIFHWVTDRRVPPDNNFAERELRPTVIARKISYGSQSLRGAETRSILMSVLQSARKRLEGASPDEWLTSVLDSLAKGPADAHRSIKPPPLLSTPSD